MRHLTDRQRIIMRHVAHGRSNQEIAQECGITYRTVRSQLREIYASLGARNRTDAAVKALPEIGPIVHTPYSRSGRRVNGQPIVPLRGFS